jgi:adenylate cyclase
LINASGREADVSEPQEERRLVTTLFCDLVGFTPLAEQLDPEDVRDIQTEYFSAMSEQIERYEGTVEKYAGDAVLALFGVPAAHEDDAERAVLCALGMQAALEPVAKRARERWQIDPALRVGVNTGEVVSGAWNASGRQEVAVTGDAVNRAARIQTAAEPGEVLVGTETMRLTRQRIQYGDKRDVVLKGKIGVVSLYPALGLRERFSERWETSEGATPLVGRDREVLELLDAWSRVQGGEGQVIMVIGDAGVGKSRLIAELVTRVAGSTAVRVVRGRCLSYGQGISLWLIADLLRSLFGIGETQALDETQGRLDGVLAALLTGCTEGTRAEALDVLGEVLGLPAGGSGVSRAGAQIRRQALTRSLKLVLRSVAERAPIVLVLEDLHWIDTASSEILKEILRDAPGLRMLALGAQRPGWTAPWSEWGWTERITLRPLQDNDAALLAGSVLGGMTLSRELEVYVGERAGGNPFFVEELLHALEESGGLAKRNGTVILAPGAADRLPSTLTEVLLARLDRLEGQVRNVAQVASVIGRNFAVLLLARVMEREVAALELPLTSLQQSEIAFPRHGSDLEYVFKHVTMREVAYNTLVQKRRQQLHLQTARAIATLYPSDEYVEIIAYHYAKTSDHAEAARWLEKAGDRAAAIYANETAIENYSEARKRQELIGGTSTVLARLDHRLGEALVTAGRYDDALPTLERAVRIYREARDLEGAGRAAAVLGRAQLVRGTPQEGLVWVQPMIEMLTWIGPSPVLASLNIALGAIFQGLGRYEEMLQAAERAAEIAETVNDNRLLGWALTQRASALTSLGRTGDARHILEDAVPLLEAEGDLARLQMALGTLGEVHRLAGRLQDARRYNERALTVAERIGNPSHAAFYLMNLGEILLTLGRWGEAREDLDRAGEMLASLPSASSYLVYLPAALGAMHLLMGAWDEAEVALQRALEIAEPNGDRQAQDMIHPALAELEIRRATPAAAIARLQPRAGKEGGSRIVIETTLAWALLEAGDLTRASELIRETTVRAREQGEVLALIGALRVQGMVLRREGKKDEAVETLEEGLALARSLPFPYEEARILTELGDARAALSIFRQLGAEQDILAIEARNPSPQE